MKKEERLYCGGDADCGANQTCVGGTCKDKIAPPPPVSEEENEDKIGE